MKIVICDDEREDADISKGLLAGYRGINDIKIYTPDEMLFDIEEDFLEADIAILDIEYHKDINGIDIGHLINKKYPACQVIYLTKITDYASDVYETEHVYFVTKQNQDITLYRAVNKAMDVYQSEQDYKHLEIFANKKKRVLQQRSILYIERIERKTFVHIKGEKFETYQSLSNFVKRLSDDFVRCHGSYIVNLRFVESIEKGAVVMTDGTTVPVGRTYQDNLMKDYMRFLAKRM